MMRLIPLALLIACGPAQAQDLRHAAPPEVPPIPAAAPVLQPPPAPHLSDAPLLAALKGVVLVPDASPASLRRVAAGVDTSAVPEARSGAFTAFLQQAIGQPASLAGLRRLADGVSQLLRKQGLPFVSVWVPPQDLTDGVVRIAVRPAVAEGPVRVEGAQYFRPESYLAEVRQRAGEPIDATALQDDVDWINRNPFRNAALAAAPGSTPDGTRLSLRVRERRPWRVFAGADNTGTRSTDTQRLFAGFNWGNAFGRGDQLSYQYRVDPARKYSTTHSGSYQADLASRRVLGLSFAWSETTPDLGPLFGQRGTSWQVGGQYRVPLPARASSGASVKHEASVGLDAKYADNNLDFVAIPVMHNKTHVAELTLGYALWREAADSSSYVSPQLVLSPGRLGGYNNDAAFAGSRMGAPARYAYVRLDAEHTQALPARLRWNVRANAQYSGVPLLGSEQIAGAGAQAVRGYRESSAFGDSGAVLRNELHLPALTLGPDGSTSLGAFLFYDAAWLHTAGVGSIGAESVRLRSAGLGVSWRLDTRASLDVAFGRPQQDLPGDRNGPYAHVRFQVAY